MASEETWPPRSARQALLSSPSGRQKYANYQSGLGPSPIKKPANTPSLLDRLRLARNNQDHLILQEREEEEKEDYEDEETLQLKLAAIEAKLKLKKLQSKTRRENDVQSSSRSQSVIGSSALGLSDSSQVEVAVSPTRRKLLITEQRSPNRILLGIDKGVKGADVSLRRARTITSSPYKERRQNGLVQSRPDSKASTVSAARFENAKMPVHSIKSFSERMAETRDHDRKQADKQDLSIKSRTRKFNVDKTELERFKESAEGGSNVRPGSSRGIETSTRYQEGIRSATVGSPRLKKSRTLPDLRAQADGTVGDSGLFEGFSGLHLSSRILPHTFLKRTLPPEQFRVYRVPDLLRDVTSPAFELPDDVADFVVFGVIASMSNPLNHKHQADDKVKSSENWEKRWVDGSQNRKKFMVMTITDLKWTIDLYLFDTALPRYHRLTPGTVIAVLNPGIMPPKKGREDTGAFSLMLCDGDDTVLEIGRASHLGHCNATKKDGQVCGSWVNSSKSEICEWHLNAQIARTQSGRMGVNAGGVGFGGKGSNGTSTAYNSGLHGGDAGRGLRPREGRGFDYESQSHYYVAASSTKGPGNYDGPPRYRTEVSAARMLDLDDPFLAEGQLSRGKEAMLQKRLAAQEKERQIAKRLANLGDGTSAGADYMMRKANGDQSLKPRDGRRHHDHSSTGGQEGGAGLAPSRMTGADFRSEVGRKRPAQDVRLSPVKKKTRFMTSTGIKEAGRESLGPGVDSHAVAHDDTDDDDLDIV